jgi:exopolysaccharide production protein ExoZ
VIESSELLERNKRMNGLQAARALAASVVALGHAILNPIQTGIAWVEFLGVYGVSLFFVISGYIMVRTTGAGPFNPLNFLLRRALRIVPLYWVACALLLLAAIALPYSFRSTTIQDPLYIVKSLFFLPAYAPRFPDQVWPFYKLGWTLNLEMFFYVSFALFAFCAARARAVLTTLVIVGFVVIGPMLPIRSAALHLYAYPINLGFVAGMWLAVLELPVAKRLTSRFAAALVALSLVSMAGTYLAFEWYVTHQLPFMVWFLSTVLLQVTLVVLYIDRRPSIVPAWAVKLGDASYSIYLFHMFAITATYRVVIAIAPDAMVLAMVLSFVASVAAGVVLHELVERPIMRRLSPIGRKKRQLDEGGIR